MPLFLYNMNNVRLANTAVLFGSEFGGFLVLVDGVDVVVAECWSWRWSAETHSHGKIRGERGLFNLFDTMGCFGHTLSQEGVK